MTTRTESTGYVPRPRIEARVAKTLGGRRVYDVAYRFDDHGRRIVPFDDANPERFLIFFGGSRTFGEGVNDDDSNLEALAGRVPVAVLHFNLDGRLWEVIDDGGSVP